MGNLSAHFSKAEFVCKCGCGSFIEQPALYAMLEEVRHAIGDVPISILSGTRCQAHNHACGGAKHSQHLLGKAADITVNGMTPYQVWQKVGKLAAVHGRGRYARFTHVDVRPGGRVDWTG